MRLTIHHETHYEYSAALKYALQQLCLTPQASAHQTVVDWTLRAPGRLYAQRDGYGNLAHSWTLARQASGKSVYRGSVQADGQVLTHGEPWLVDDAQAPPPVVYLRTTALTAPDACLTALGREHLGQASAAAVAPAESVLLRLASAVRERVRYRSGVTDVGTSAAQALALGVGVCQDHAHVFIAACRAAGLPARYVSGYFHSPQAADMASHAWADVCVDVAARRWLSIDITHDTLMDGRHVRLAVGPDYAACAPIRGVREGGGTETMRVRMQVRETTEHNPPLEP